MKKILVLAPVSSGHIQKWLFNSLDDFEIFVFTLHPGQFSYSHPNLKVFNCKRITSTRLDFMLALIPLSRFIKRVKPDLVYSSFLSSYGILGALIKFNGPKLLSTWGTDVNGKPNKYWLVRKLCSFALSKYDWINAPAVHIKRKLISLGAPEEKIEVFQYGIDLDYYFKSKKDFTKRCCSTLKFISIRNWDDLYNVKNIILSYSKFCLENHNLESTLYVVGRGSHEQQNKLKSLISSMSYGKGGVELLGFLVQDELVSLLNKSDAVISIPSMDGTPLSLLESMYLGLYPIVSDIDANREWLSEESSAIVKFDDLDSIKSGFEKSFQKLNVQRDYSYVEVNRSLVVDKADFNKNTLRLKRTFEKYNNVNSLKVTL